MDTFKLLAMESALSNAQIIKVLFEVNGVVRSNRFPVWHPHRVAAVWSGHAIAGC